MDDRGCREDMGRYGRKRVENELAWPYQAVHLLEAYKVLTADLGQAASKKGEQNYDITHTQLLIPVKVFK